jgi:Fic family protein
MDRIGQASALAELSRTVAALPPSGVLRDAVATLRLDEITGSTRLAGAHLDLIEVRALLERSRALGGHRFEEYVLVRDYASAAAWSANAARQRKPIGADDLRALHRLAVRGLADDGGIWRTTNLAPLADGTVPPAHWLVPFETETLVGRLALDEDAPAPVALARAIARLTRLRPFRTGNGRVARLTANVLATRRGLPPIVLDGRAQSRYGPALRAADARDLAPLVTLVQRALIRGLERIRDAAHAPGDLAPLAAFASGNADALYKAAQRGRLRVVRRDGRLLTTQAWVDAYRGLSR